VKEFTFPLFQSAFSFKGWDHLEVVGHNGMINLTCHYSFLRLETQLKIDETIPETMFRIFKR